MTEKIIEIQQQQCQCLNIKGLKLVLDVFIRVIELVSNGYHSLCLYFESVIFRICVTGGHTQIASVSHSAVEDQLFELLD